MKFMNKPRIRTKRHPKNLTADFADGTDKNEAEGIVEKTRIFTAEYAEHAEVRKKRL
jgi:hypothetical protein